MINIPTAGGEVDLSKITSKAAPSELGNGLLTTYGEISAFAGDYFGYDKPISSESTTEQMKDVFKRWFDILGYSPGGKGKAEAVRAVLQTVNDQAEEVLPSASNYDDAAAADQLALVYQKNPLDIWHLDNITKDARWANGAAP